MSEIHNLIIINIAEKHDVSPKKVQAILDDYFGGIGGLKSGKGLTKPIKLGTDISVDVSGSNLGQRKPPLVIGAGFTKVQMQKFDETIEELLNKAKINVKG